MRVSTHNIPADVQERCRQIGEYDPYALDQLIDDAAIQVWERLWGGEDDMERARR